MDTVSIAFAFPLSGEQIEIESFEVSIYINCNCIVEKSTDKAVLVVSGISMLSKLNTLSIRIQNFWPKKKILVKQGHNLWIIIQKVLYMQRDTVLASLNLTWQKKTWSSNIEFISKNRILT